MEKYHLELNELEAEKNRRIQQLPVCRARLSKAVSRNKSKKAMLTLLTKPHYSELPKSFTSSFFSSFVGERGLTRSILNHITGEDLLPTKQRVYLRPGRRSTRSWNMMNLRSHLRIQVIRSWSIPLGQTSLIIAK